MLPEEPINKRRRVNGDLSQDATQHANTNNPLFSPIHVQPASNVSENMDTFLSPGTPSSWPFDEFAHDPNYLASQEALRLLMFDTARSVAPTRANTPVNGEDPNSAMKFKHVMANGSRIQYLKNYLSNVAPWVSLSKVFYHG